MKSIKKKPLKKNDGEPNIIITKVPRKRYLKKNSKEIMRMDRGMLPLELQMYYGCPYCEWKKTSLCPYGFTKKSDRYLSREQGKAHHSRPMCRERHDFLKSLLDPNKIYTSLKDYRHDISLSLEHRDYMKFYFEIKNMEGKLEKLKKNPEENKKEIKELKKEIQDLLEKKNYIWSQVSKYDDKYLDRTTPRKMEVTEEKKLTLHQINELIGNTGEKKEERKIIIEEDDS